MVPSPVWFQLVGADGLPFKGSRVNSSRLSRSSSIVEFCKAVKAEYDQPSFLKDIPPAMLNVFENKAALETNNPLEVDGIIGELGNSKNDPLIVFVPDQISSGNHSSLLTISDI
jgi:hypothetical protein